jgi:uncharacterized protein (TIGR03435 family)
MLGGPGTSAPGQISFSGASLKGLILAAYGVKAYQLSAPAWMATERFDIVAKAPEGTTRAQVRSMLQRLLAERFGLQLHHESQELPGYELQIAKEGLKLKPPAAIVSQADKAQESVLLQGATDRMPPRISEGKAIYWDRSLGYGILLLPSGLFRAVGVSQTMAEIVTLCELRSQISIVDKTGLTVRYDYSFDYAPDPPANPQDAASIPTATDPGPDFVTAFQKQLGFKLEKKKLPFDVLVVDRADKVPVEN